MPRIIDGDGGCGELSQASHHIKRAEALRMRLRKHPGQESLAKNLPAGALGGPPLDERVPQPRLDQTFVGTSPKRPHASAIHYQLALAEVPGGQVQQDIRGPGVKRKNDRPRPCSPIDGGNIADASKIIDTDVPTAPGKHLHVKKRR